MHVPELCKLESFRLKVQTAPLHVEVDVPKQGPPVTSTTKNTLWASSKLGLDGMLVSLAEIAAESQHIGIKTKTISSVVKALEDLRSKGVQIFSRTEVRMISSEFLAIPLNTFWYLRADLCSSYRKSPTEWWSYRLCHFVNVNQLHVSENAQQT